MSRSLDPEALASLERVLLVGDLHGNLPAAHAAARTAVAHHCNLLIQVGDLGIGPFSGSFTYADYVSALEHGVFEGDLDPFTTALDEALAEHGLGMLVAPGNHENYDRIDAAPRDEHGRIELGQHWRALPRGYRWSMGGRAFGAVGGAFSIDRRWRREHTSWWPQEEITQTDIDALGDDRLDVLITHEVPQGTPVMSSFNLPHQLEVASALGRDLLIQAVGRTSPDLVVSGHWHQRVSGILRGRTRVEVLHMERERGALAVLDLTDLSVTTVTEER